MDESSLSRLLMNDLNLFLKNKDIDSMCNFFDTLKDIFREMGQSDTSFIQISKSLEKILLELREI